MAVSRDLLTETASQLVPRVSLSYNNYFIKNEGAFYFADTTNKAGNSVILGIELNLGLPLSNTLEFIVNPGYSHNFTVQNDGGFVTGGFLIK